MSNMFFPHFPLTLFFCFCLFFSFSYAHLKSHETPHCDCSSAHNNSHENIPTKPGNSSPAHNNSHEVPAKPGNSSPPIGCLPLHISLCPVKAALDHMGCAAACCGAVGGPLNFNLHSLCGSPGTVKCNDPSKFISWDGIHLTEAMNRKVTDLFLNQGFCQPSFSELVKSKSGM